MTTTNAVHFVIRAGRSDAVALADRAEELFLRNDWTVTRSLLDDDRAPEYSLGNSVDTVIAFGGDGTFLEAVRIAYPRGAKVGGINLGRLGYLAGFEASEAEALFERVRATKGTPMADTLKALAAENGKALTANALAADEHWAALVSATLEEPS